MAKIDTLKEKLGELKFWRGIIVAVIIAVLGWIFTSYDTANNTLLFLGSMAIFALCVILFFLTKTIKRKIDELEDF